MAPEVAMKKPYNESADVYSFSHILYHMLALEKPYKTYSKHTHRVKVVRGGERPTIDSQWPRGIQELLARSWSSNINERPSMTEVIAILKHSVSDLTGKKPLVASDAMTVFSFESLEQQTGKSGGSSPSFVPMPKVISVKDLKAAA